MSTLKWRGYPPPPLFFCSGVALLNFYTMTNVIHFWYQITLKDFVDTIKTSATNNVNLSQCRQRSPGFGTFSSSLDGYLLLPVHDMEYFIPTGSHLRVGASIHNPLIIARCGIQSFKLSVLLYWIEQPLHWFVDVNIHDANLKFHFKTRRVKYLCLEEKSFNTLPSITWQDRNNHSQIVWICKRINGFSLNFARR